MIVVTGGAGFIGSALVWKLNTLGERDILVVDQKAENTPKWRNMASLAYSSYMEYDVFLQTLENGGFNGKLKAVIHMGACSDTTERDEKFLRSNNTLYSAKLAEWCVAQKVYFSYASSAATYGAGELCYSDADELTPSLEPLNLFGWSKLNFDNWVLRERLEKKITGFRFFNVYGPNEYHKGHMRSMVQKGYEQIRDTGRIQLFRSYKPEYADGGQMRDFVYVKDVVDAMLWFYQNPGKTGIFNIGQGRPQSWNDLANAIFETMGKKPEIEYIEMPEALKDQYQYYTAADLKKLRATGCPTAFTDLKGGVADYVAYLKSSNPFLKP